MADVTPYRSNIQAEDVQFRASVSEAVGSKIAGSVNMINTYQYDAKGWFVNGPYYILGAQTGIDGAYVCMSNLEIYGLEMYNLVGGSSGTLQFDIIRHTSSGTVGSTIFSTKPALSTASGNNAYLAKRFSDSTVLQNPTGATQPVLISANLNAGDMLTCDMTSVQTGGQNAGIVLHLRPRN